MNLIEVKPIRDELNLPLLSMIGPAHLHLVGRGWHFFQFYSNFIRKFCKQSGDPDLGLHCLPNVP